MTNFVYQKSTIEFVTVGHEFCKFLEQAENNPPKDFIFTASRILPLLYLKASMLKYSTSEDPSEESEEIVTEDMYQIVRINIASLLGSKDDFLDVFLPDIQYTETPIICSIAENMADIYQDIKNFIFVYQMGIEEHMEAALEKCVINFRQYWGQKLVNVLRALHTLCYDDSAFEEEKAEDPQKKDFGFFSDIQNQYENQK